MTGSTDSEPTMPTERMRTRYMEEGEEPVPGRLAWGLKPKQVCEQSSTMLMLCRRKRLRRRVHQTLGRWQRLGVPGGNLLCLGEGGGEG